eukprot:1779950-Amphidinium_carterae.1
MPRNWDIASVHHSFIHSFIHHSVDTWSNATALTNKRTKVQGKISQSEGRKARTQARRGTQKGLN